MSPPVGVGGGVWFSQPVVFRLPGVVGGPARRQATAWCAGFPPFVGVRLSVASLEDGLVGGEFVRGEVSWFSGLSFGPSFPGFRLARGSVWRSLDERASRSSSGVLGRLWPGHEWSLQYALVGRQGGRAE